MATNRFINEWTDGAGGFLRSANWVDPSGGLATLQAAMQAISNAQLTFSTSGAPRTTATPPVSGVTWYLCTDTVILNFLKSDGQNTQLVLPAPMQGIFLPDRLVVDPSNALILALTAAAVGTLSDVNGNDVVSFTSGTKSSRRTEQNAPPS